MARNRNKSAAQRAAKFKEFAVVVNGKRQVIPEAYFLFLMLAGVVKRSRRGQGRQLTLQPGWQFRQETLETENNGHSASKDEWVLRRTLPSGQEIVLSDAALISFLGVLMRRREKFAKAVKCN